MYLLNFLLNFNIYTKRVAFKPNDKKVFWYISLILPLSRENFKYIYNKSVYREKQLGRGMQAD